MRAAIFIDGGYVLAQFRQMKITPDYSRLADYFLAPLRKDVPLDLLRVYFYYCAPWMSPEPSEDELRRMEAHKEFVEVLENLPRWTIRLGKLQKRFDGNKEYFEQKRVDVLLTCDMVRHTASRDIQHAVLVAGDSDFIPAVETAKDSGATVTLWCGPPNTVHKDLIMLSDEVHNLDWRKFPQDRGNTPAGRIQEKIAAPTLQQPVAPANGNSGNGSGRKKARGRRGRGTGTRENRE